jgi:hypothetical protein
MSNDLKEQVDEDGVHANDGEEFPVLSMPPLIHPPIKKYQCK